MKKSTNSQKEQSTKRWLSTDEKLKIQSIPDTWNKLQFTNTNLFHTSIGGSIGLLGQKFPQNFGSVKLAFESQRAVILILNSGAIFSYQLEHPGHTLNLINNLRLNWHKFIKMQTSYLNLVLIYEHAHSSSWTIVCLANILYVHMYESNLAYWKVWQNKIRCVVS